MTKQRLSVHFNHAVVARTIANAVQTKERAMVRTLEEIGGKVAEDAERYAPKATGRLADSIVARPPSKRGKTWATIIGSDVPYAALVEFRNRAYLRPALAGARRLVRGASWRKG